MPPGLLARMGIGVLLGLLMMVTFTAVAVLWTGTLFGLVSAKTALIATAAVVALYTVVGIWGSRRIHRQLAAERARALRGEATR